MSAPRSCNAQPAQIREKGKPRPPLARILCFLLLALWIPPSLPSAAETLPDSNLQAAVAAIGTHPDALFTHVRDRIKPTLHHRAMQSPVQVLTSGCGNTEERARLLAALLTAAGHPVRFQSGALEDAQASILLQAALPSTERIQRWPAGIPLSHPETDPALLDGLRRHTWVQVLHAGSWQDMDPAFAASSPGKRFAEPQATFYRFSPSRLPRLELTLEYNRSTSPDAFEELLWWDGPLEEVVALPLSLRIYPRITSATTSQEEELHPAARLVDPLAGGEEQTGPPASVTTWQADLFLGDERLTGAHLPDRAAEEGSLRTLRLRARIIFAEDDVIEELRVLAETDAAGKLPLFQRHALFFASAPVAPSALERWLESLPSGQRAAVQQEITRIRHELATDKDVSPSQLGAVLAAEQTLGPFSGHLLNLAYCVLSEQLFADLARRLGVHAYNNEPRLIITSVLTSADGRQQVLLDLRRDRQAALALPGQPRRIVESYQFGCGVLASALEGELVELATGTPALTTAALMRQARLQGIATRLYSARERELLARLPLAESVRLRVDQALRAGQVVLLPIGPVQVDGQPRSAWWQIDPPSWHTIGVLDSGLHQAVVERTLIETEGVLSDEMAAVIGAISGAADTQFAVSAMVLKHGELTAAALAEAKDVMNNLGEALCQQLTVEAKVGGSATLASASVEMEGCFRYEQSLEIGAEAGGSLTLMDKGWCEAFQRGFTCSAMTILNAYRDQP